MKLNFFAICFRHPDFPYVSGGSFLSICVRFFLGWNGCWIRGSGYILAVWSGMFVPAHLNAQEGDPVVRMLNASMTYVLPFDKVLLEAEVLSEAPVDGIVRFYVNQTEIGQSETEPYRIEWVPGSIGKFQVHAEFSQGADSSNSESIEIFTGANPYKIVTKDFALKRISNAASDGATMYVAFQSGEVWESEDLLNWRMSFHPHFGEVTEVLAVNGHVWANTQDRGYYHLVQETGQWEFLPLHLDLHYARPYAVGDLFVAEYNHDYFSNDLRHWQKIEWFENHRGDFLSVFKGQLVGVNDGDNSGTLSPAVTVYVSGDGLAWQSYNFPGRGHVVHMQELEDRFYVYSYDRYADSGEKVNFHSTDDFVNWRDEAVPDAEFTEFDEMELSEDAAVLRKSSGAFSCWISVDGLQTWQAVNDGTSVSSIKKIGERFYARTGIRGFRYSEDGINWQLVTTTAGNNISTYGSGGILSFDAGSLMWAQDIRFTRKSFVLARSPDGIEWIELTGQDTPGTFLGAAYGHAGWVLVGEDSMAHSADGSAWQVYEKPDDFNGEVVFGNGVYVAVSDEGGIGYSHDGLAWNSVGLLDTSTSLGRYSIAFLKSEARFILSMEGAHFWSDDGIVWNRFEPRGVSGFFRFYEANQHLFARVGSFGDYAGGFSTDGINWTDFEGMDNPESITYRNGIYFGFNGDGPKKPAISPDGRNWILTNVNAYTQFKSFSGLYYSTRHPFDNAVEAFFSSDGAGWRPAAFTTGFTRTFQSVGMEFSVGGNLVLLPQKAFHLSYQKDVGVILDWADQGSSVRDYIQQSDNLTDWMPVSPDAEGNIGAKFFLLPPSGRIFIRGAE